MAGQKFQYDESGSTFFYFLISVLGLVLVPCSFYFWPAEEVEADENKKTDPCLCEGCIVKDDRLKQPEKWRHMKKRLQRAVLLVGWCCLAILVYKVQQFDYEYANFDPYDILGIGTQTSMSDIKKAYRKLSLVLHPDKPTGDEKKFMKLNKAYQALTDETSRKNYELYGNPDGPGAMDFGIALPSWIIEKENSLWVLGLYGLVFMIGLPTVVAIWWYRSSKFSNDQVLLDTSQIYYYFIHKTPQMAFKRALMLLAASLEFEKGHNHEIKERPSDNIEIPQLIKFMVGLGEKNKERPLCFPYSIKARALLHAHLARMQLNLNTLDQDRLYVVKLCPTLINEMVNCVSQLIMLAHAGRVSRLPTLDTIEATMKLNPHIVQAIGEGKSAILQLPHVLEESIRYFVNRKKPVKTVQQYVALPPDERRQILRNITDDQYANIMKVCASFPLIDMKVISEVVDDDDTVVFTAGAIVTVTVSLTRRSLQEIFYEKEHDISVRSSNTDQDDEKRIVVPQALKSESGWKRPQIKRPKAFKKKTTSSQLHSSRQSYVAQTQTQSAAASTNATPKMKKKKKVERGVQDLDNDSDDQSNSRSHSDESEAGEADSESHREAEDEDAEWEKFQKGLTKREKVLEGKSKYSHSVHSPYFTDDKQEYWWTYVCDKKKRMLVTAPYQITNLVTVEEVQLKFTAPLKPGNYTFQVCLKSDSYLGFDKTEDIKLDVKEAREIPTEHPQWEEFSSDDDNPNDENLDNDDDSPFTTDDDITEDSD